MRCCPTEHRSGSYESVAICTKKRDLHIIVVKLYSPLLDVLTPHSTNVRWERVAQCVRAGRRNAWVHTVLSWTGADAYICTGVRAIASGIGRSFRIARSL